MSSKNPKTCMELNRLEWERLHRQMPNSEMKCQIELSIGGQTNQEVQAKINGNKMTTDILEQHGFLPSGTCRCDGYFTHKFRKGLYEIRWRKGKYTFKIKYKNDTITEWQNISLLENALNELDQKNIQAKA